MTWATAWYAHGADPLFGAARHYGYAVQWFSLCGLIVFLYVFFHVRRIRTEKSPGKFCSSAAGVACHRSWPRVTTFTSSILPAIGRCFFRATSEPYQMKKDSAKLAKVSGGWLQEGN